MQYAGKQPHSPWSAARTAVRDYRNRTGGIFYMEISNRISRCRAIWRKNRGDGWTAMGLRPLRCGHWHCFTGCGTDAMGHKTSFCSASSATMPPTVLPGRINADYPGTLSAHVSYEHQLDRRLREMPLKTIQPPKELDRLSLPEFFFRAHQLYSCCEPGLERDALFIQMVTERIVAVLGEGAVLQHCKTARQTVS